MPGVYLALSASGVVLSVSEDGATQMGYEPGEVTGRSILDLCRPDEAALVAGRLSRCAAEPYRGFSWHTERVRKDGSLLGVHETARAIRDGERGVVILLTAMDAADCGSRRAPGPGAPRMEAIGRLAGGVAHDFNNLLTAIRGFTELHLATHPPGDPAREEVLEIDAAARRAVELTQSLLAVSRKAKVNPERLDLSALARQSAPLLQRLVGDDVVVELRATRRPCTVLADRIQLDQILLNLAANARDAMPDGGTVGVSVRRKTLDRSYVSQHPGSRAGRYIELSVSDSGVGMDEDTVAHVFEPFYTTKAPGEGTGLGMATVYGIVKQAAGYIEVSTRPGCGTVVRIYLPEFDAATDETVPLCGPEHDRSPRPQGRVVLLVEDDPDVRTVAERALSAVGYTTLSFADPRAALRAALDRPSAFDALVTDVMMPRLSGPKLAERIALFRPELPVLFMTGHEDLAGMPGTPVRVLTKPFRTLELVAAIDALFAEGPERTPQLVPAHQTVPAPDQP